MKGRFNILLRNIGTPCTTLRTVEKSEGKFPGQEVLVGFQEEKEFSVPSRGWTRDYRY